MTTEIRIQELETENAKKQIQASVENTQEELTCLEKTLKGITLLLEQEKPYTTSYQELKNFADRIRQEITINKQILDEESHSLEIIRARILK